MTDENEAMQQTSALVDGELPPAEAQQAADRLSGTPELAGCWECYHLVGDALRGNLSPGLAKDFSSRVMQGLGDDPPHNVIPLPPPRARLPSASRRRAGMAYGLAASLGVAVALVLAPEPGNEPVAPLAGSFSSMAVNQNAPAQDRLRVVAQPVIAVTAPPAVHPRLASYLEAHTGKSAPSAVHNGMTTIISSKSVIVRDAPQSK